MMCVLASARTARPVCVIAKGSTNASDLRAQTIRTPVDSDADGDVYVGRARTFLLLLTAIWRRHVPPSHSAKIGVTKQLLLRGRAPKRFVADKQQQSRAHGAYEGDPKSLFWGCGSTWRATTPPQTTPSLALDPNRAVGPPGLWW